MRAMNLTVALLALSATGCVVLIERELDDKPSTAELASRARDAATNDDASVLAADVDMRPVEAAADAATPDSTQLDGARPERDAGAPNSEAPKDAAQAGVDAARAPRDTPVKLCAGATHACGLMPSGKLTCWGRNDDYQLDVGRDAPAERYLDLTCGDYHTCAITSTGAVRCAGRNRSGQVSRAPSDTGYVQISAGDAHSCALRSDGSALCWGDGSHGQDVVPAATPPLKTISSGAQFNCGLRKADGVAVCWGNPGSGRLTPPPRAFLKIDAGGESACGITTDGKVACWGLVSGERLLDAVELSVDAHTSVSSLHACAICTDRSLYCWDSSVPTPTMDAQKFAAVAVGPSAVCTLTESGILTCTPDEPTASIATAKPPNYPDEPLAN